VTPNVAAIEARKLPAARAIEASAKSLDQLRNGWLYPANLIKRVPEIAKGFPTRIEPKDATAAKTLAALTLTTLYNDRPTGWLKRADCSMRRSHELMAGRSILRSTRPYGYFLTLIWQEPRKSYEPQSDKSHATAKPNSALSSPPPRFR
jgi:hypothetical protein